jgi:DNA-binding NtrC family response regulator
LKQFYIYEYDQKNRYLFFEAAEEKGLTFLTLHFDEQLKQDLEEVHNSGVIFDITPYFRDDEKAQSFSLIIESIVNKFQEDWPVYFVIDKRYTYIIKDTMFYLVKGVKPFETELSIEIEKSQSLIDLSEEEFEKLTTNLQENLIGNLKFKSRLQEELRKYRVFNKLGYQPIFSALLCGSSGIGKTEVARILHKTLSPGESFIKINFGNYSDQNALSSLIGSPRGYIGSSKGELSEKLNNSKSRVILIDEFEKCDKQVQNFFLQLLEDGIFTDSLGRDYDLDKYIIIFTANLPAEDVSKKLSRELISRFNLKYSLSKLTEEEKKLYVKKRATSIVEDVYTKFGLNIKTETETVIEQIDVANYDNMRDINNIIMNKISELLYPHIYK